MMRYPAVIMAGGLLLAAATFGHAQQVVVGTPMQNVGDSFFENFGVGFGGRFPGGFFNGPPQAGVPGLPGINPVGGANLGFGLRGGGFGLDFNVNALQGSSRSFNSVTPSVTVPNGGTGTIFSGSQRPFVTGLVPVVGGYGFNVPRPYYPTSAGRPIYPIRDRIRQYYAGLATNPSRGSGPSLTLKAPAPSASERLAASVGTGSSAARGDLSVAEIKRQRSARLSAEDTDKQREIKALVERARGAEEAGKYGAARVYLRQAISRAQGELRVELSKKLQSLGSR